MRGLKTILLSILLLIAAGCSNTASGDIKDEESVAKEVVDSYLQLMKEGNIEEASEYIGHSVILPSNDLIDVFSYEYLDTMDVHTFTKTILIISKAGLSEAEWQAEVDSVYKEYADSEKYEILEFDAKPELYLDKEIWVKDLNITSKAYEFLYDMELADEQGNKIYKKVEITADWSLEEERYFLYIEKR